MVDLVLFQTTGLELLTYQRRLSSQQQRESMQVFPQCSNSNRLYQIRIGLIQRFAISVHIPHRLSWHGQSTKKMRHPSLVHIIEELYETMSGSYRFSALWQTCPKRTYILSIVTYFQNWVIHKKEKTWFASRQENSKTPFWHILRSTVSIVDSSFSLFISSVCSWNSALTLKHQLTLQNAARIACKFQAASLNLSWQEDVFHDGKVPYQDGPLDAQFRCDSPRHPPLRIDQMNGFS